MENTPHPEIKQNNLEQLFERAIVWAEERSQAALEGGTSLTEQEFEFARAVGVEHPELVRVLEVDAIPVPLNPELKAKAEEM